VRDRPSRHLRRRRRPVGLGEAGGRRRRRGLGRRPLHPRAPVLLALSTTGAGATPGQNVQKRTLLTQRWCPILWRAPNVGMRTSRPSLKGRVETPCPMILMIPGVILSVRQPDRRSRNRATGSCQKGDWMIGRVSPPARWSFGSLSLGGRG